jgi:hypothetical protein
MFEWKKLCLQNAFRKFHFVYMPYKESNLQPIWDLSSNPLILDKTDYNNKLGAADACALTGQCLIPALNLGKLML